MGRRLKKSYVRQRFVSRDDPTAERHPTLHSPLSTLSLFLSSSHHAQSRPQELRPRRRAGRLQSALSPSPPFSTFFACSTGPIQSRALPAARLLFLAHTRQQRPVCICSSVIALATSDNPVFALFTNAMHLFVWALVTRHAQLRLRSLRFSSPA